MMERRAGPKIGERETRMLVGFAFFAELVLGWLLLLDPPAARLAKLERELAVARETLGGLKAAAQATPAPLGSKPDALLPALKLASNEAPALAIQRHMADLAAATGVQLSSVLVADPVAEAPPGQRHVEVVVTSEYGAIDRFVGRLAWPDVRAGIERLDLKPEDKAGGRVRAELKLLVELGT